MYCQLANSAISQTIVSPKDDLSALVKQAPPGTRFVLLPGKHRAANLLPKDGHVFEGRRGAILSGAVHIGPFVRDGRHWRATGPEPLLRSHGECDESLVASPMDCLWREVLFANDRPLKRVFRRNDLKDGAWFYDRYAAQVYLGFDPGSQVVELSYRDTAFHGSAQQVTIRGLIIQQYASIAQHGAIHGDDTSDWTIVDNEVRFNSGVGIRTGHRMRVARNRILHNGQLGIGGLGKGILVEYNEIAHNNTLGYSPAWEAGATKFVETENLIVSRNCVHANQGHGIWTDYHNVDSAILGNWSIRNLDTGIFHELSGRAVIAGNVSMLNGSRGDSPWSSQILVSGSIDTLVWRNQVRVARDAGNGIVIVEEDRENGEKYLHSFPKFVSRDNVVMANRIIFSGPAGYSGFSTYSSDTSEIVSHNRFEDNEILVVDGGDHRFKIAEETLDLAQARNRGQELRSRVANTRESLGNEPSCPDGVGPPGPS